MVVGRCEDPIGEPPEDGLRPGVFGVERAIFPGVRPVPSGAAQIAHVFPQDGTLDGAVVQFRRVGHVHIGQFPVLVAELTEALHLVGARLLTLFRRNVFLVLIFGSRVLRLHFNLALSSDRRQNFPLYCVSRNDFLIFLFDVHVDGRGSSTRRQVVLKDSVQIQLVQQSPFLRYSREYVVEISVQDCLGLAGKLPGRVR